MSDAPKHAFELTISLGGETWPDVVRALNSIANHVEDHGPECGITSGGGGSAYYVNIVKRDVTPEQYRKELAEWMEARRAVTAPSQPTSEPSK